MIKRSLSVSRISGFPFIIFLKNFCFLHIFQIESFIFTTITLSQILSHILMVLDFCQVLQFSVVLILNLILLLKNNCSQSFQKIFLIILKVLLFSQQISFLFLIKIFRLLKFKFEIFKLQQIRFNIALKIICII